MKRRREGRENSERRRLRRNLTFNEYGGNLTRDFKHLNIQN